MPGPYFCMKCGQVGEGAYASTRSFELGPRNCRQRDARQKKSLPFNSRSPFRSFQVAHIHSMGGLMLEHMFTHIRAPSSKDREPDFYKHRDLYAQVHKKVLFVVAVASAAGGSKVADIIEDPGAPFFMVAGYSSNMLGGIQYLTALMIHLVSSVKSILREVLLSTVRLIAARVR